MINHQTLPIVRLDFFGTCHCRSYENFWLKNINTVHQWSTRDSNPNIYKIIASNLEGWILKSALLEETLRTSKLVLEISQLRPQQPDVLKFQIRESSTVMLHLPCFSGERPWSRRSNARETRRISDAVGRAPRDRDLWLLPWGFGGWKGSSVRAHWLNTSH